MNYAKTVILALLALLMFASFGGTEETGNPFKDWRAPFNETELAALNTALLAANLTMKDLSFEKKAADQAYILDTVKRMMDEPMYGATVADLTSRKVFGASKAPVKAFRYLPSLLDLPVTPLCTAYPDAKDARRELIASYSGREAAQMKDALAAIGRLPSPLSEALVLLLWSAREADNELKLAFSVLTAEESNLMLAYLPAYSTSGAVDFSSLGSGYKAEKSVQDILKIANKVDLSKVMYASEQMLAVVRAVGDSLRKSDIAAISRALPVAAKHSSKLNVPADLPNHFRVETPLGVVDVRGTLDDIHTEDAAFIIDLGGNAGDFLDSVIGKLDFDILGQQHFPVLPGQRSLGFGEDTYEIRSAQGVELNTNRQSSL